MKSRKRSPLPFPLILLFSASAENKETKWAPHGFPPGASPPGPSSEKDVLEGIKGGGNFEKGTALGVGVGGGVVHSPGHGPRAALEPGRVSLQDTQTFEPPSRPFQTGRLERQGEEKEGDEQRKERERGERTHR